MMVLPGGGSLAREITAESGNLDDVEGERSCYAGIFGAIWNELIEQLAFCFRKDSLCCNAELDRFSIVIQKIRQ
jgi:hypothetical protein